MNVRNWTRIEPLADTSEPDSNFLDCERVIKLGIFFAENIEERIFERTKSDSMT